jgi:hypothetical protein
MKRLLPGIVLLLSFVCCNSADLKMTIVKDPAPGSQTTPQTTPGGSNEWATIYVHGSSQRVEFNGAIYPHPQAHMRHVLQFRPDLQPSMQHMAVITHCDTGIIDEVYLDSGEYREFRGPRYPSEEKFRKMVKNAGKGSKKTRTVSTTDTGESRDFFGHIARHKITTLTDKGPGTRISSNQMHKGIVYTEVTEYKDIEYHETIDGWYVDLPQAGCAPDYVRAGVAAPASWVDYCDHDGCDRDGLPSGDSRGPGGVELREWQGFYAYSFIPGPDDASAPFGLRGVTRFDARYSTAEEHTYLVYTGLPSGLPVAQKTSGEITLVERFSGKSRKETEAPWGYTVTEYSESPLDPALFTVPAAFKKMK